jgi:hypothetical protein
MNSSLEVCHTQGLSTTPNFKNNPEPPAFASILKATSFILKETPSAMLAPPALHEPLQPKALSS